MGLNYKKNINEQTLYLCVLIKQKNYLLILTQYILYFTYSILLACESVRLVNLQKKNKKISAFQFWKTTRFVFEKKIPFIFWCFIYSQSKNSFCVTVVICINLSTLFFYLESFYRLEACKQLLLFILVCGLLCPSLLQNQSINCDWGWKLLFIFCWD